VDRVQDFLGGRVASVSIGKPRHSGGKIVAVARVGVIDPLKRVNSVSLDYWLGAKGRARPPGVTLPEALKGDSPHQTVALRLADGLAEGKWTIPIPEDGQVIWAQPRIVTKSGEKRWAAAVIVRPAPPEEDGADAPAAAKTDADEEKRATAARQDAKKLEGTWKLIRREVGGALEDVDDLKVAVVIEDGKMIWTKNEKDTGLKASVDLDPTANPRAIDLEFVGLKKFGEQRLGIYELKDDKLMICTNLAEDKRPKKFTTRLSVGCGTILETYQRVPD
jgi:uncharacterized protein (TIGR03067 family)